MNSYIIVVKHSPLSTTCWEGFVALYPMHMRSLTIVTNFPHLSESLVPLSNLHMYTSFQFEEICEMRFPVSSTLLYFISLRYHSLHLLRFNAYVPCLITKYALQFTLIRK